MAKKLKLPDKIALSLGRYLKKAKKRDAKMSKLFFGGLKNQDGTVIEWFRSPK